MKRKLSEITQKFNCIESPVRTNVRNDGEEDHTERDNSMVESGVKSILRVVGHQSSGKKVAFSIEKNFNVDTSEKKQNFSGRKKRLTMAAMNGSAIFGDEFD